MANVEFDASTLTKHITVTVHIKRVNLLQLRLWLGTKIIVLGAFIAGLGYKEIELDG